MLWGGTKIRDCLHKDTGELNRIAESWELSTHKNGMCLVDGGDFDGKTLNEYFDAVGWECAGDFSMRRHQLPIMIKYIDAKENLSVQVHPTETYARKHSGDGGKDEMWYILDADEDACIYLGFRRDVTKEEVRAAIENGSILSLLNRVTVRRGEVYYIPAGTIHAIGAGCLLCEIQQTSDATYRLYDYNRLDDNGRPRRLDVKDGLAVLNCRKTAIRHSRPERRNGRGDVYKLSFSEYHAEGEATYLFPKAKFVAVLILDGEGQLDCDGTGPVRRGETWLAMSQSVKITGKCHALIVGY